MHHTPQASQRARQVEIWAALRTLGRQGVTDLIVRTCGHAQAMAAQLREAGLEVLNDVVLNQVLVRAATDEATLALVDAVQQDGTCWCGATTWQHRPAIRISVSSWATSKDDITSSAHAIIAAYQQAGKGKAGTQPHPGTTG
jgi:aromatic-L-amino-acid decarboxylase